VIWAFPPLVLLFLLFPGLDLSVAAWFWSPDTGFVGDRSEILNGVRSLLDATVTSAVLVGFGVWAWSHAQSAPERVRQLRRPLVYGMLVLMLGPGLLVNVVFKDHWGRARPHQIQTFGGERQFTPAWVASRQCERNCSFVCGDASVGFSLLALGFFGQRRRFWFAAGITTGGLLGLVRMAQGGHFLSDVIFSGYAVALTAWLLALWLRPDEAPT
jgi:lipid A 4'-phosphatase